jgi:prepilin-type N-terminal cleavage/methylation domain-containing protein
MKMFRKEEGFTLVELMVVVLIIGILVAIAIPVFNAAKAKAEEKSCFANERTLEGAYQSYLAGDGASLAGQNYATYTGNLVTAKYVQAVPVCKAGGAYTATVTSSTANIDCGTHGHF